MNFMEAKTEIDGLVQKKNEIINKAANLLASAIIDRARTKGITSHNEQNTTIKDIGNAISAFPSEDRELIIKKAITIIVANGKFIGENKTKRSVDSDDDFSDLFGNGRSSMFKPRH